MWYKYYYQNITKLFGHTECVSILYYEGVLTHVFIVKFATLKRILYIQEVLSHFELNQIYCIANIENQCWRLLAWENVCLKIFFAMGKKLCIFSAAKCSTKNHFCISTILRIEYLYINMYYVYIYINIYTYIIIYTYIYLFMYIYI